MVSAIGQADLIQQLQRPLSRLSVGNVGVGQRHHHVFHCAGAGQKIEALKDESNLGVSQRRPLIGGVVGDFLAIEPILPGCRPIQTSEEVHERALAGAGLSHQRHHFAALDLERDALKHGDLDLAEEVGLVDVLQVDKSHQRPPPPPPPPPPAPPRPAPPAPPAPPPPPAPRPRPNCGANGLVPPATPPEDS